MLDICVLRRNNAFRTTFQEVFNDNSGALESSNLLIAARKFQEAEISESRNSFFSWSLVKAVISFNFGKKLSRWSSTYSPYLHRCN